MSCNAFGVGRRRSYGRRQKMGLGDGVQIGSTLNRRIDRSPTGRHCNSPPPPPPLLRRILRLLCTSAATQALCSLSLRHCPPSRCQIQGACHRGAKPGYQKQAQYQCCAVAFFWVLNFAKMWKIEIERDFSIIIFLFFLKKIVKFWKKIKFFFFVTYELLF